jgi:hypothetical protein
MEPTTVLDMRYDERRVTVTTDAQGIIRDVSIG